MPASPKIPYRYCGIREVEVLGIVEATHRAKSNGHIGICGEIKVELHRKQDRTKPYPEGW